MMEGNEGDLETGRLEIIESGEPGPFGAVDSPVEDLNDVRERSGLGPYAGSTDSEDLRREIFNERDRELFGEGQRYFDIIRNGYLDRLSEAYQQLTAKDIENGALYRPVAQRSFNNNELMTQNKYWLWRR